MYGLIIAVGLLIPIIAKVVFHRNITILEMVIQITVVMGLVIGGYNIAKWGSLQDTEVWNGALVSHNRVNDSHMESYSCNCRTVCSGSGNTRSCSTHCDTCWRRRYTVDWYYNTTIGNFSVGHRNSLSSSVHRVADPAHFVDAWDGMPVSREHGYTNYILGARRSLFNVDGTIMDRWEDMIPEYPRVYDYTEIDRVVPGGYETFPNMSFVRELDEELDNCLRELGPEQQVNIVVVLANSQSSNYADALEMEWSGGKKNDVIVVIGAPNYPEIAWVDTLTLAGNFGNTLLVDAMATSLNQIGTLEDAQLISETIQNNVREHFERVPMENFEYLRSEVRPNPWVVWTLMVVSILVSGGLTILFQRYDISIEAFRNRGYRRYRRW
jgi:hypothetical protein